MLTLKLIVSQIHFEETHSGSFQLNHQGGLAFTHPFQAGSADLALGRGEIQVWFLDLIYLLDNIP